MENNFNIDIIGLGALGVMYGDHFSKHGANVKFIADEDRIKKYKKQGVFINGRPCEFEFVTPEAAAPCDLFIFAVKGNALEGAIREARGAINENTIIISVLNGIVSEEIISRELGGKNVLYSVAQGMDAVKLGNKMTYEYKGQILFGYPKSQSYKKQTANRLSQIFDKTAFPYTAVDDIEHRMWAKWMLNVGVNQVVMVKEGNYGIVQKEGVTREMMKAAMREVIELSKFEGVNLSEDDMCALIALIDPLNPENMPSMRQDGIEKRHSEVDFFAGTVIEKAKRFGLKVPVNEYLYKKVKEMESKY